MIPATYIHIKDIDIPIYKGIFVIVFCNDLELLKKTIPSLKDDFDDGKLYAHTIFTDYKGSESFVCIFNFDHEITDISPGVIAHEALHIVHRLAEERGIQVNTYNDEPITYLLEWVTNTIYEFMEEKGYSAKLNEPDHQVPNAKGL